MASSTPYAFSLIMLMLVILTTCNAPLNSTFYAKSCPNVLSTVKAAVKQAVAKEKRMATRLALSISVHGRRLTARPWPGGQPHRVLPGNSQVGTGIGAPPSHSRWIYLSYHRLPFGLYAPSRH
eukprot:Gb_17548 [translate_table: standard]